MLERVLPISISAEDLAGKFRVSALIHLAKPRKKKRPASVLAGLLAGSFFANLAIQGYFSLPLLLRSRLT